MLRRILTILAIAICLQAMPSLAQTPAASITGTVVDPAGAPAKNATVQAKSSDGAVTERATTDAGGRYTIRLAPGTYDISIAIPGLRAFQKNGVAVNGGSVTLDIRLEEGTQLSTLGEDPAGIAADRLRRKPPSGPTPRTADGKPDFSGVWWGPTVTDPGKPEWLPEAQRIAAERVANNGKDSPQVHCLPWAVLRRGPLVEFVQSRTTIVEITDDDSPGFHKIYLNRGHPTEPDYLWHGDSVGTWDGDVLVVDRINFNEESWLDQGSHPHSDKLHVVERYRRPDLGHLEVQVTVEDPGVLARPYTLTRTHELAPSEEIREFICNENNSDVPHLVGR